MQVKAHSFHYHFHVSRGGLSNCRRHVLPHQFSKAEGCCKRQEAAGTETNAPPGQTTCSRVNSNNSRHRSDDRLIYASTTNRNIV